MEIIRDDYDSIIKNGEDMLLCQNENGDVKWVKSTEQTFSDYRHMIFSGNRTRPVKEILFEGVCIQDGIPTPNYPKEIKVNDSIWGMRGHNLYNPDATKIDNLYSFLVATKPTPCTANLDSIEIGQHPIFNNSYYGIVIPSKKGDIFRVFWFGDTPVSARRKYIEFNEKGYATSIHNYPDTSGFTINIESDDCAFLVISWAVNVDTTDIVITRGSNIVKEYEPYYIGGRVDLSEIKLAGIGEVKDTFNSQNGVHIKKIEKIVYTGNENIVLESPNVFYDSKVNNNAVASRIVSCSHLQSVSNVKSGLENVFMSPTKRINFETNEIEHTLEAFKSWLAEQYAAGTPVTVYYELNTPITEQLTPQPITQYKRINNFTQISGSTNNSLIRLKGYTTSQPSWNTIQNLVRSGIGPKCFPIGTEFITHNTFYDNDIIWRVIGYDHIKKHDDPNAHTMLLQMKDVWSDSTGYHKLYSYTLPQAFYYTDIEMPAGTYHFTVANQDWYPDDNGKTFQFTMLRSLPIGGQLSFSSDVADNKTLDGKHLQTYSSPYSIFVNEESLLSLGNNGVDLGIIDGTGNTNHMHRVLWGSNNFAQSPIKDILNSLNYEYSPHTKFDRFSTSLAASDAFLRYIPYDFQSVLATPDLICRTNLFFEVNSLDGTVFEPNQIYVDNSKIFILSTPEMFGKYDDPDYEDGTQADFYFNGENTYTIKHDLIGTPCAYWTRTPASNIKHTESAHANRLVLNSGAMTSFNSMAELPISTAVIIG